MHHRDLQQREALRGAHEAGTKVVRRRVAAAAGALLFASTLELCGALPLNQAAAARVISVTITDSGFNPSQITALLDKPLNLRITNQGRRAHEFAIPDYYIFTQNLAPGASTTVGFTPDKPGQFTIMSDPSGNDNPEFTGKLTVTDAK
ncbi:cupredoxin domain-containing protein [Alicyclobacillus sp. ALC3]|uniref:cupredoxin domain-containing protein n=1 Tax=Alicyclobacillus sp. ALC3 TaxID=2796143 RepID=UPI0023799E72|nr:cupredoxin domain-containing protein [Alicyclobacillus sp. ALC3]WDL97863.1 cupredoxin domain-containing protein [Alicyclobacillus sp. ALC3]